MLVHIYLGFLKTVHYHDGSHSGRVNEKQCSYRYRNINGTYGIHENYGDSYSHAVDRLTREELLLDVFHEMAVNSLGRAMSYLTLVYRTSHKIKEDTVRQAVRLVAPVIRNTGRVEGSFIRELCAWGRSWVLNLWNLM